MPSGIQWCDEVWNPTLGCTRVSPGCEHCYAERVAHRGMQDAHQGFTRMTSRAPVWNGTVRLLPERLEQPLRWREPRRVFVDSMSDLFHEVAQARYVRAGEDAVRRLHLALFLTAQCGGPEVMVSADGWGSA